MNKSLGIERWSAHRNISLIYEEQWIIKAVVFRGMTSCSLVDSPTSKKMSNVIVLDNGNHDCIILIRYINIRTEKTNRVRWSGNNYGSGTDVWCFKMTKSNNE
jgi:hypothetical protein